MRNMGGGKKKLTLKQMKRRGEKKERKESESKGFTTFPFLTVALNSAIFGPPRVGFPPHSISAFAAPSFTRISLCSIMAIPIAVVPVPHEGSICPIGIFNGKTARASPRCSGCKSYKQRAGDVLYNCASDSEDIFVSVCRADSFISSKWKSSKCKDLPQFD